MTAPRCWYPSPSRFLARLCVSLGVSPDTPSMRRAMVVGRTGGGRSGRGTGAWSRLMGSARPEVHRIWLTEGWDPWSCAEVLS